MPVARPCDRHGNPRRMAAFLLGVFLLCVGLVALAYTHGGAIARCARVIACSMESTIPPPCLRGGLQAGGPHGTKGTSTDTKGTSTDAWNVSFSR